MSIKVLVVDDSALIREVLTRMLSRDGDIEVVDTATDPIDARQKIKDLNPDVVTLDIEMPNMNGLQFLEKLMRLRPTPVIMVSTLTKKGASETLLALELGAVDFVAKPSAEFAGGIEAFGVGLREKIRAAAKSDVRGRSASRAEPPKLAVKTAAAPNGALIAIGASTGGVEAIRAVLSQMPADCPPIVIAQHMPPGFTGRFAARLDEVCAIKVIEAEDRMPLLPGHAYVAKGDFHLRVERSSGQLKCRLTQDELTSGHRPSVDILFESVAKTVGNMAVGAILTGMGRDGARGLKLMRDAGAYTVGQSKSSALVYGMPRVAFEEGAVVEQAPVEDIASRLANALVRLKSAA
ncbi:chemotaxis response regulator protein-glutamate methylesterase [Devosia sp. J2-20]|jgi:two-component system, chemotaxis family, protein-glutamate methylesterase/glutaminase|uniref:Protein-glutamate methylesterase/protein-glutamine glutaminase n=1 Tax=Devosia litorisediminis TaxID=2829817 RepID=A0A942I6C1_9HYPH|nr:MULTISPECIES: chemotaxis response regulator protein-glutamate methylesterase [Devosia]MBS3850146.1 chemotaxis response regulator protein-glutamate methylesterase [Devosia litorisediminis]MCZ4347633.1 chemotaxis response regulator protein-glutamate methylesterase [Devosia neptuniae]WDQ99920.1 chemotaxis response regulator protein-glutamate methylesterase [Devosia sp. J2-20]|tara:strand:- start:4926 stop:5975 length:1050 start_codon:yes stop_codon:yes gene_type:complete